MRVSVEIAGDRDAWWGRGGVSSIPTYLRDGDGTSYLYENCSTLGGKRDWLISGRFNHLIAEKGTVHDNYMYNLQQSAGS